MSKDLKKRGFNFVGSTICYAFMQAVGMVNDHSVECFRYAQVRTSHVGFLNDKHVGPDASSGRAGERSSPGLQRRVRGKDIPAFSGAGRKKTRPGLARSGRVRAPAPTWTAVRII